MIHMTNRLRAAIYARVSSEGQRDRHTIESQLRDLPAYCARQGWEIVATYIDDGRSAKAGKLAARGGFTRLRAEIATDMFDVVVVVDLDRLTRSEDLRERGDILGVFQRAGVKIATPDGQILDLSTTSGDLLATLQTCIAAEENRKRRERTIAGKATAIARGKKPAGPTPYGYSYNRDTGVWSIHEGHAAVVHEIFERVARGDTCVAIADDLHARGLTRPRGGEWIRERVWQIVVSSTYRGTWLADKARKLSVPVPRIVEDDLWASAQEALLARGKRGLRRTRHVYLLESLAVCSICTAPIGIASAIKNGPASYRAPSRYVCNHRRRPLRGHERCTLPLLRTEDIDARLWARVEQLFKQRNLVEQALELHRSNADESESWSSDLKTYDAKLARLQHAEAAALKLHRHGLVSEDGLANELQTISKERRMLEQQVATAHTAVATAAASLAQTRQLRDAVARLRARVRDASPAQRKALMVALLNPGDVVLTPTQIEASVGLRLPDSADRPAFAAGSNSERWTIVKFRLVA